MVLSKHKNLIAFFLIVGVCAVVFFPSLFHVIRSDQDNFFLETVEIEGLSDLIRSTYSYNRWRFFAPGDEQAFKPLYFIFLSFGQWLLGFRSFFWQLTSVALHMTLVWQLWRTLNAIFPHILSVFLALHFSVLLLGVEMVNFQHMFPCIIHYILLLKALQCCLTFMNSRQKDRRYFWTMFVSLSLMCFIRETGVVYTVLMMITVFLHRKLYLERAFRDSRKSVTLFDRINPWILSLPIVVFFTWNVYDYILRGREADITAGVSGTPVLFQFIGAAHLYPFLPSFLKFNLPEYPHWRVVAESFQLRELISRYTPGGFAANMNLLLVVLLGVTGVMALVIVCKIGKRMAEHQGVMLKDPDRFRLVGNGYIAGVCTVCAIAYCVLLYIGRFSVKGMVSLQMNSYYFYPLVMLNIILVYALFSILSSSMKKGELRLITGLSVAVLSLSVMLNGYHSYRLNVDLKEYAKPILAKREAVGRKEYYLATRYNERGMIRAQKKSYKEALEDFHKSKKFDPSNVHVDYNMGMVYFSLNDFHKSEVSLTHALALRPEDANVYYYRGLVYQQLNQPKSALADFNQAIIYGPHDVRAYVGRSRAYYAQQDFGPALVDAQRAQTLGYEWPRWYLADLIKK